MEKSYGSLGPRGVDRDILGKKLLRELCCCHRPCPCCPCCPRRPRRPRRPRPSFHLVPNVVERNAATTTIADPCQTVAGFALTGGNGGVTEGASKSATTTSACVTAVDGWPAHDMRPLPPAGFFVAAYVCALP